MGAPGVSDLIAWIRSQIAKDKACADGEAAVTSVSDDLNASHDLKDVQAVADTHHPLAHTRLIHAVG
ncbi:hypothetical protein [Actinosynnema sp. NPDC023587]|uniref:hypothetical protein n=1 Tax=Actinosynnema sp. NPDC023587 TaxID=3154695 RepID=UPI0033EF6239